eukprot:m.520001 g.520001  ORF g.520001 m.520001 type:complete len:93 (-) comp57492_c1_seq1:712-990(-)
MGSFQSWPHTELAFLKSILQLHLPANTAISKAQAAPSSVPVNSATTKVLTATTSASSSASPATELSKASSTTTVTFSFEQSILFVLLNDAGL